MSTNQPTAAQPIDLDKLEAAMRRAYMADEIYAPTSPGKVLDLIALARQQPAASGAGEVAASEKDEILSLHRQLAGERLRADQGWERAEAKSRECIELRERQAAPHAPADDLSPAYKWLEMVAATNYGEVRQAALSMMAYYQGAAFPAPAAPHAQAEPVTVDWLGLALDLEAQAKRVQSQTAERAMNAAANGLRLMGAAPVPQEAEHAFAWAAFADNGNVIIWSRQRSVVEPVAAKYGRPVTPVIAFHTDKPVQEAEQAAPAAVTDAHLLAEQMFEIARPYFAWNAADWRKATQGTISMTGLLAYTRAALNAVAPAAPAVTDAARDVLADAKPEGWWQGGA
jgi:hypothetical protein